MFYPGNNQIDGNFDEIGQLSNSSEHQDNLGSDEKGVKDEIKKFFIFKYKCIKEIERQYKEYLY
jgi:hypothetical protein